MSALRNVFRFVFSLVLVCILSGCGFPEEISRDPRVSSISGKTFLLKEDIWIVDWRLSDYGSVKIVSPDKSPKKIQVFKGNEVHHYNFEDVVAKNKGKFPKGTIVKINRVFRERSTFGMDHFFVEFNTNLPKYKTVKIDPQNIFESIPWADSQRGEQFLILDKSLFQEIDKNHRLEE